MEIANEEVAAFPHFHSRVLDESETVHSEDILGLIQLPTQELYTYEGKYEYKSAILFGRNDLTVEATVYFRWSAVCIACLTDIEHHRLIPYFL